MEPAIRSRRESVLLSLYSSQNGLIVHCSAVEDSGSSFIFAGVADAGKSTLANKLGKIMTVINDDMNILEFCDKKVKVSTYFTQAENQGYHYVINEDASGLLKAVLFPVKELENDSYLEQLADKGFIWKMLLNCVAPPITGEDHLFPNYYRMIDKLMESVPFFNIHHNLKDSAEHIATLLRKIK
ncbi:MAG TPA: hypothetical protein PLX56_11325 [bacterium]|nr:hypothetical protein [bacterium]